MLFFLLFFSSSPSFSRLRTELNKAFKRFVERTEEIARDDPNSRNGLKNFDVPMRELGFSGAPFKEMVLVQPCSDCLVAVTDKPVSDVILLLMYQGRG